MASNNAHHLLLAALKVTPPELHPPEPFHGGGPQPKVDALHYAHAAVWLADRVEPLVDAKDRTEFQRWTGLARRQIELGAGDTSLQSELFQANAGSTSRVPLKIALWSAHEASNWAFRPIYAGGAARPAAGQLAKLLLKKASPDDVRAYLIDLDALCLRLEAMTLIAERKLQVPAPVERTLFRAHADGKATQWLSRLASGEFCLVFKLGARWSTVVGSREEVVASVPDRHFEEAVRAAMKA